MPELFNTKRFKRGSSLVRLYCRLKRLAM